MKLPYSEGSVFLVPLKSGGYARGVVARSGSTGKVIFGYFFGPRLKSQAIAGMNGLEPSKAILRLKFGDLGLINGDWKILGNLPSWDRTKWAMSEFITRIPNPASGKVLLIRYMDGDPNRVEKSVEVDPREHRDLPPDSLSGSGSIEIKLDKMLD